MKKMIDVAFAEVLMWGNLILSCGILLTFWQLLRVWRKREDRIVENVREYWVRNSISKREIELLMIKTDRISSRLEDIQKALFVKDFFASPEDKDIPIGEAVSFRRFVIEGKGERKDFRVEKLWTSKKNFQEHKNEIQEMNKKVEDFNKDIANLQSKYAK